MFYHQLNALYLKKTYIRFPQNVLKTPTYVWASLKPSSGGVTQLRLLKKKHVHALVQYYTPYGSWKSDGVNNENESCELYGV